jgi:carbamoyltransferase
MRTDMDYLVIDNYLFSKKDQPEWKEKDDWKVILTID